MINPTPELTRDELLLRYSKQAANDEADSSRRSPFKFLDSYQVEDAEIFFGRDAEIEALLRHYHSIGHVLIYGESGSGKSSLVQSGLRPRIPAADALFISLRVNSAGVDTLSRQIIEAVSTQLGQLIEVDETKPLIDTLAVAREIASRPLVLFFDQFEELFVFHTFETRRRLARELAAIQESKLGIKVILGIRQDYLAHLSELEDVVGGVFDNRFWLRRMSRENAADAVRKACEFCHIEINTELVRSIMVRLDPDGYGVELPYLQVVMDRLYRRIVQTDADTLKITPADVDALGDIPNILAMFLMEEVGKLPFPEAGRQTLKAFVSREGTRRSLHRSELSQEVAGYGEPIPADVLDANLQQLANVRLLKEVADDGTFELRHDSLARTISAWISEIEKELIEVRDTLLNRFREFEARNCSDNALLDAEFLGDLMVYRQRLLPMLDDSVQVFLTRSDRHAVAKQRRRRFIAAGLTAAVLVVLLLSLLVHLSSVKKERDRARSAEDFAEAKAEESFLIKEFFIYHLRNSRGAQFGESVPRKVSDLEIDDQKKRADIFHELGEIFVKLGDLVLAEEHLNRALEIRRLLRVTNESERNARLRDIADSEARIGFLRFVQGRTDESEILLTQASKKLDECQASESDPLRIYTRFILNVVRSEGLAKWDVAIAARTYAQCDADYATLQTLVPAPESQVVLLMTRAGLRFDQASWNSIDAAEKAVLVGEGAALVLQAKEQHGRVPAELDLPRVMLDFAEPIFFQFLGRIDNKEFEELGLQLLERVRASFGAQNPAVLVLEREFAKRVDDPNKKRLLVFNNLELCRRTYIDEPIVALPMFEWAKVLEEDESLKAAEEQWIEAINVLTSAYEQPHWRVGQAHLFLGQFYSRHDRAAEAESQLRVALRIFEETRTLAYSELGVLCQKELDTIVSR